MVTMQIAALLLAVGVGDTVLLDFTAPWCGPCRSMEGTIAELEQAGHPIRKVNIDRERALASKYSVTQIPCFVLVVDGKEAGRITGATRRSELLDLLKRGKPAQTPSSTTLARGQSPDPAPASIAMPPQFDQKSLGAATRTGSAVPAAWQAPASTASPASAADAQTLIAASVRLAIKDGQGCSYGTGTIIDARQGDALVLTCGHIFRESGGKGDISVELLDPQANLKLPGTVLTYDLKSDLALVAISPGRPVKSVPVAPRGVAPGKGDRVTTVGCNHGGPPTAVASYISAVNKFLGAPNLQVAGQPVQGRSGGGLFSAEGYVIGVCNAADPADNEGLYAALAAIHAQLDQAKLTALYERPTRPDLQTTLASAPARPEPARLQPTEMAAMSNSRDPMAGLTPAERSTLAAISAPPAGAEVICIVRPLSDPTAKSEVIKLDRASSAFLRQLAADQEAQVSRHFTSHNVQASGQSRALPNPMR